MIITASIETVIAVASILQSARDVFPRSIQDRAIRACEIREELMEHASGTITLRAVHDLPRVSLPFRAETFEGQVRFQHSNFRLRKHKLGNQHVFDAPDQSPTSWVSSEVDEEQVWTELGTEVLDHRKRNRLRLSEPLLHERFPCDLDLPFEFVSHFSGNRITQYLRSPLARWEYNSDATILVSIVMILPSGDAARYHITLLPDDQYYPLERDYEFRKSGSSTWAPLYAVHGTDLEPMAGFMIPRRVVLQRRMDVPGLMSIVLQRLEVDRLVFAPTIWNATADAAPYPGRDAVRDLALESGDEQTNRSQAIDRYLATAQSLAIRGAEIDTPNLQDVLVLKTPWTLRHKTTLIVAMLCCMMGASALLLRSTQLGRSIPFVSSFIVVGLAAATLTAVLTKWNADFGAHCWPILEDRYRARYESICGAESLYACSKIRRLNTTYPEVIRVTERERERGTSIRALSIAATELGFSKSEMQLGTGHSLVAPSIIHLRNDHFVALVSRINGWNVAIDTLVGVVVFDDSALGQLWSGWSVHLE